MDLANTTQSWTYPTNIHFGCGLSSNLAHYCEEAEFHRPMIITDQKLIENSIITPCIDSLCNSKISFNIFTDFEENPTDKSVMEGLTVFQKNKNDGLVAIGGGSAIDLAKSVAFMDGQSQPIFNFEDRFDWWKKANKEKIRRVIAIPTTAGTGSEVGRAAVIKDTQDLKKKIIFHPQMMPFIAILDAKLTIGMPAHLTAATGVDALVHNLEALCSTRYHPIADGVAIEGLRLIKNNIEKAFQNGNDLNARCAMLVGSTMGAIAFQKGLGGVHALSHPIGSLFNSHHGLTNAVLLPYVIEYNLPEIHEPLSLVSKYLNLNSEKPKAIISWLLKLRDSLQIPHKLSSLGVNSTHIPALTKMALNDQAAATNPRILNETAITSIYKSSINGILEL